MNINKREAKRILVLVNEHLPDGPLTLKDGEVSFLDRGMDSIEFVNLVVDLENAFDFSWPMELFSLEEAHTLACVMEIVGGRMLEGGATA